MLLSNSHRNKNTTKPFLPIHYASLISQTAKKKKEKIKQIYFMITAFSSSFSTTLKFSNYWLLFQAFTELVVIKDLLLLSSVPSWHVTPPQ